MSSDGTLGGTGTLNNTGTLNGIDTSTFEEGPGCTFAGNIAVVKA